MPLVLVAILGCAQPGPGAGEESPAPYELCDGSRDVRLAIASDGGGPLAASFEFTNPYGHRFLYVTGECQFLTGTSLAGSVRLGRLTRAQAQHINDTLVLERVARWPAYRDESCPDAGVFYVQTLAGYGECSCYCDEDGPDGVAETVEAAQDVLDELTDAGEALSGPVELVAFLRPDGWGPSAVAWPLELELQDIELPYSDFVHGVPPPTQVLDGAAAEAARMLRASSATADSDRGIMVRDDDTDQVYEVYIRDQVPAELAAAIEAFRQRPHARTEASSPETLSFWGSTGW